MGAFRGIFKRVGGFLGLTPPDLPDLQFPDSKKEDDKESGLRRERQRRRAGSSGIVTGPLGAGSPDNRRRRVLG